jgi:pSer/pThr/pTyr-binding forkhead associated (FHA) protein
LNGERVKRARVRHLDVITLGRFAELVFVARETALPDTAAALAPAGMVVQLQWLDGPSAGETVTLPHGEIVIGRAETCGLVVDSDAVSRMHARLRITDDSVTIEDLGTVNGTAVNGEPVSAAMPLESGAEVDVGQVQRFKLIVNRAASAPAPAEDQDDFGSTRLVWSPKDLEMLEKARAAGKSGPRGAVKPATAAPLPIGRKPASAPAPPPSPSAAPVFPSPPAAAAPTSVQSGPASGETQRSPIVGTDRTALVPPTLDAPPLMQPPSGDDGKTRYEAVAAVKLPQQFQSDAPTSLGLGAPEDVPDSLGERTEEGQRTAVTPVTSLDPPTSLEPPTAFDRAMVGADDQTALPFATSFADGVRTELGGSPFDLPSETGTSNVVSAEDLPTSLGGAPDSDPATYMPANAFNPRDRTNLPPDTVLGFRDVGPSQRGPGSSGATYLAPPREPENIPSAIQPAVPTAGQESLSTIESIKLTGDSGVYEVKRGTATVGRSSDATIRIDSREMSRIHAILSITEHEVIVEDRGSINGTSVNGTAITGRRTLVHGDRVCFADFEFRLEVKRTEGHP